MIRIITAILLLSGSGLAQASGPRMEQVVQTFVPNKQFMGAVLVARGDEILLSKGYGLANVEWELPNTAATKFRIGSVTKQFTAASILLLEERGKLKVEDPINKYIPDPPAAWDKITIFHLLTHTSGIRSAIGVPGDSFTLPITPAESVALVRGKPLDFEPGTNWAYNNSGYVMLGYLIERISGQTYEKFLQDNIFTPLGMKDSGYDLGSRIIPRRAAGYSSGPNGPVNASFADMTRPYSAGSLYSTVEDLLKWEQGLFGGKLLSQVSLEKMTTPFKNNYAFGLSVGNVNGHKIIEHSGGIQGFNTMLSYYPDEKITVAVLGNLSGSAPAQIAALMGRMVHGEIVTMLSERKEIPLAPQVLSRLAGTYQMPTGGNMLITAESNQLYSKLANQNQISIFPESETRFFAKAVEAQIDFSGKDAQGRPTELTFSQNGRITTGKRLSETEAQRLVDAAAALAKRVRDGTPQSGSETALRRVMEELRNGQPNYSLLNISVADTIRQQLTQLQATVKQVGAFKSISLTSVTQAGADIYLAEMEKGSLECRIMLGADGKVEAFGIRALSN